MKRVSVLVPILASLTLSACGGSPGGDQSTSAPMPPPAATTTSFTTFMRTQMGDSMTTETAVPAEMEAINWDFTDDSNGTGFDDIFTAAM